MRVRGAVVLVGVTVAAAAIACTDLGVNGGSSGPNPDTVVTEVTKISGDSQTATVNAVLPQPIRVQVMNTFGHPATNATVCFAPINGGNLVGAGADRNFCALADTGGYASAAWQLGTRLGGYHVAAGTSAVSVVFSSMATAAAPKTMTAGPPASFSGSAGAPLPDSIFVTVQDTFGNAVQGVWVHWTATGGSTVSPESVLTSAAGAARASWTLGPAGADTATAAIGTLKALFTATSN